METIILPPSASALMESTRSIGYSLPSAIADIVDNSIAAGASVIKIMYMPVNKPYVVIADNGCGMSFAELKNAMQYGSKNPQDTRAEDDLGRYGLGLKTASLSQCQKLTVITKQNNDISGCCWDLQHIHRENNWSLLILDDQDIASMPCIELLNNLSSGTLVIWQNLDRIMITGDPQRDVLGTKMIRVGEHLSLVFHRYLAGEETGRSLQISMNNKQIFPIDPFMVSQSTRAMADEKIIVNGTQEILVRPYILPHVSKLSPSELASLGGKEGLRKSQGFYVYRNKRLVVWGTWFRMMVKGDLSKLARIQVDIPNTLDDLWTLDIKKSTAIPPEEVQKNLRSIVDKIAEKSKQTWTYRGKQERSATKTEFWQRLQTRDGGFFYQINRDHPIIQKIKDLHPDTTKPLFTLLSLIEDKLPLNSLYIDMVQDEKITNNDEQDEKSIFLKFLDVLTLFQTDSEKKKAFPDLIKVSPFCDHADYIKKQINEELL